MVEYHYLKFCEKRSNSPNLFLENLCRSESGMHFNFWVPMIFQLIVITVSAIASAGLFS